MEKTLGLEKIQISRILEQAEKTDEKGIGSGRTNRSRRHWVRNR